MKFFLQNYKALIKGGVITVGLLIVLSAIDFIIINPAHVLENILILGFWWLFISFLVYKIPYFKKNISTVYKVLGLIVLFIVAMIVDNHMEIPDNPITLPLVILIWLGFAYLILPHFFKKYKIAILAVYGAVLSYFFIFRMTPNYLEDHHQNVINFMLIPIPVLITLWIYEQWRWLKTLKADKAKAELTLLKSQINPHFFFNTLNNLYGLAVEKSEQAPAMILKLSDIMRYTIYEGKADFVPIKEDVAYLEDYIELHRIRYQKKVAITFHQNLEYTYEIAPLLLVVLLENAFKHGIESLAQNAFLEIELNTTSTGIFFQISNNFEPKEQRNEGIGLSNLKKRLALIYPNQHQLEITKTADIYTASLKIEPNEVLNYR